MNPLQNIIDQLLANTIGATGQPQNPGFNMIPLQARQGSGGGGGGSTVSMGQPSPAPAPLPQPFSAQGAPMGQPQGAPPGAPPGAPQGQPQGAPRGYPGMPAPGSWGASGKAMPDALRQQIMESQAEMARIQDLQGRGAINRARAGSMMKGAMERASVAQKNYDDWMKRQQADSRDQLYDSTFQTVYGLSEKISGKGDPEVAKYVTDLKMHSPEIADKIIEQMAQRAYPEPTPQTNIFNPPPLKPGYMNIFDPATGRVVRQERVPGGPAEEEYQRELTAQRSRWRNVRTKADAQAKRVRAIFEDVGYDTAGIIGEVMSYVPGTSAFDLKKEAETVLSNVAFGTMEELKMASPSGATGLGQVQIREFEALQNSLGNLAQGQSPENLKEGLIGVLLFAERQKEYAQNREKYDAMTDEEYFNWVDDFNQSVINSVSDPEASLRKKYNLPDSEED